MPTPRAPQFPPRSPDDAMKASTGHRPQSRWRHVERLQDHLRERFWLRMHVFLIAALMLVALMLGGAALRLLGVESLAARYALLLSGSYLLYLGLLRLWAAALLRGESPIDGAPDVLDAGVRATDGLARRATSAPFHSGQGGDFAGGGASGDFSTEVPTAFSTDLPTPLSTACSSDLSPVSEAAGNAMGSAGDALGGLDDGLVVAIPLMLILGIATALGVCVFGLFGVEVLLAVAVEVALASVAGGMAWRRMSEEGWWRCALRRTWGPALALLVVGVLLGAGIDHWIPDARSLLHAWQLIRVG